MCFRALGITSSDVFEGTPIAEFAEWAHITVTGKTWSEDGTLTGFSPGDRMLFLENLARIRCVSLSHQFNVADEDLSWGEMDRVARALVAFKAAMVTAGISGASSIVVPTVTGSSLSFTA